jgi:hypothetical protein
MTVQDKRLRTACGVISTQPGRLSVIAGVCFSLSNVMFFISVANLFCELTGQTTVFAVAQLVPALPLSAIPPPPPPGTVNSKFACGCSNKLALSRLLLFCACDLAVSARVKEATFILMAGTGRFSMHAVSTTFAISTSHVVTCAHSIESNATFYAAARVVRLGAGYDLVSYLRRTQHESATTDWLILEAVDAAGVAQPNAFPSHLDFAAHDRLPALVHQPGDPADHTHVRIPHAPVRKLNSRITDRLAIEMTDARRVLNYEYAWTSGSDTASLDMGPASTPLIDPAVDPAALFMSVAGDLSGGASGAPYCYAGHSVCAMHLQSINDSSTIAEAIAAIKARAAKKLGIAAILGDPEMESGSETYGGVTLGVVLVRDEQFVRALRLLANIEINPTVTP